MKHSTTFLGHQQEIRSKTNDKQTSYMKPPGSVAKLLEGLNPYCLCEFATLILMRLQTVCSVLYHIIETLQWNTYSNIVRKQSKGSSGDLKPECKTTNRTTMGPTKDIYCQASIFWNKFRNITKTRLFKYIENFTTIKGKFSDKKPVLNT